MAAFLLPRGLSADTLRLIAADALDLTGIISDSVRFDEPGGDIDLNLSVPFLAGMDDVVVDVARLTLHGIDAATSIDGWHTVNGPAGQGTFVVLEHPARLLRLVIGEPAPVPGRFLVVRAATLGATGAPVEGAPLAANHAFPTGRMLPSPLAGLDVSGVGSGRLTLALPATAGSAWLVQSATGDSLDALTPAPGTPPVFSVTVVPAPEDVTLVLMAGDGAAEQPLWQHPGAVLAAAGDQLADFTPAARARLSHALTALNATDGGAPVIGLPLRFHSARGGTLGIRDRTLDVRYLARPLGPDPRPLTLDGGWQDLVLEAPVRAPGGSELRLSAKHRGLAVNAGSGVPPTAPPSGGLRVRTGRVVAARATWQAPSDLLADGPDRLAEIRLYAVPVGDTEVVCEVRRDAAGAPGGLVAPPAVTRVAGSAAPGWIGLTLAAPVAPVPGPLWVTARTNQGELDWFGAPSPADGAPTVEMEVSDAPVSGALVSVDGGSTWASPDGGLGPASFPLTQLLDRVDPGTRPPPTLQLRIGPAPAGTLSLAPAGVVGEYVEAAPTLPDDVLAALRAPGQGPRRRVPLSLWSPDLLDVTVTTLTCSYDPFVTFDIGPRPESAGSATS